MNKNQKFIKMEETIKKTVSEDGSKSVSYRKEWKKDGLYYSKEVRQVEGGYIIRECKHGKPSDSPDGEYIDETKESVSTENPFQKKEKETKDDQMFSFIDTPSLF